MTTVICICRVADYDAFRPGYDKARELFAAPTRSWRLCRGQDDPNLVLIEETFDSRETAEAIWTARRLQRQWKPTESTWRASESNTWTK
jgi:hypothetical protein